MGSYQYVYGRRVWAQRVASLCGVIVLVGVAGCSSSSDRMGYYGSREAYHATGAVPVPPEPVYSEGNGYRQGGSGYTAASYSGDDRVQRRAPFATGAYSENQTSATVQRTALTPVSGYGGSSSYTRTPSTRYAANDGATHDGGNIYAMQVANHEGEGNRGSAGNGGGDTNSRQPVPVDDFRSQYRSYDNDSRYGTPPKNGGQYQPGQYATGAVAGNVYVVETGDTVYSIAHRFHINTAELIELNGLRGTEIHPGQRLRVGQGHTASNPPSWRQPANSTGGNSRGSGYVDERYGNGATASYSSDNRSGRSEDRDRRDARSNVAANPRSYEEGSSERQPQKAPTNDYTTYTGPSGRKDAVAYSVQRGDTVFEVARRNGISHRELADFNDISPTAKLYPGQRLLIPAGKGYDWSGQRAAAAVVQPTKRAPSGTERVAASSAPSKPTPAPQVRPSKPVAVAEVRASQPEITSGAGTRTAMASPEQTQVIADRHEESSAPAEHLGPRECEAMLSNPSPRSAKMFREPVSGAVISKFGPKEDGSFNDGVNFSVPKGTSVKAAENGVVAYAGNELTGFGNLVLIRHADGFVTAYAHNDELLVKRCDVVKRGQTIGKAGVSGNATKPQLHFELRKDSKPVDPEQHFSRS